MYDAFATDSNNVPREGAAVSSHWVIPDADPWGLVKGMRFGTAAGPYFRTVVHEIGHAMGLFHNTVDNGFMNTTNVIASAGTAVTPFPNNVQWSFAPDDQKRLRHYPDIFVRPGGTAFGTASTTSPPISPTDLEVAVDGLELHVASLLPTVPLGAPVRVNLRLVNVGDQPVVAPSTLSLKSDFVRGAVTDPAGTARSFSPLVRCIDAHEMTVLEPGASIEHSLTLLRGPAGALFPAPGPHEVRVDVHWTVEGVEAVVSGSTTMLVTAAVDEAHAEAALEVLSTPDTLLTLVIGGDHLDEGNAAVQAALENEVLHPHFAFVEAKRVAERFGKRKANLKAAADLIDDATVMSPAEVKRAALLVKAQKPDSAPGRSIQKTLKEKVATLDVSEDVKEMVDSL